MNDVPPSQEPSDDDVDTLYRRASALDRSRPSAGVSRAILAHAELVSTERALQPDSAGTGADRARMRRTWWRPAIFGTLAAAALAGLFVLPNVRTSYLAPQTYPRVALPKTVSPSPEPLSNSLQSAPASSAAAAKSVAARNADAPSPAPASKSRDKHSPTEALASRAVGQLAVPIDAVKAAADGKEPASGLSEEVVVEAHRRTAQNEVVASAPIAASALDSTASTASLAPPDMQVGSPGALHRAAETGDLKALQASLDQLTDINSRDEFGRTALLLATLHGQTKAVKRLLAHGADPNIADTNGTTPLQAATSGGKSALIAALKRAGAH